MRGARESDQAGRAANATPVLMPGANSRPVMQPSGLAAGVQTGLTFSSDVP
jgi:hypothetical protein